MTTEQQLELRRLVLEHYKAQPLFAHAKETAEGIAVETFVTAETKDVNEKDFEITHLISTPRIDYVRDVMNPFGVDSTPLDKNKSVFYNHRWDGPRDLPIGKNLWIKKTKQGDLAKTRYAVEDYAFAGDIFKLVAAGYLNSYSIGFMGIKMTFMTLEDAVKLIGSSFDIPNAADYQPDAGVLYYEKWLLYEYSQVGVPMNQDAVVQKAVQKNLRKAIDEGMVRSDFGKLVFGNLAEKSTTLVWSKDGTVVQVVDDEGKKAAEKVRKVVSECEAILKEMRDGASSMADACTRMTEAAKSDETLDQDQKDVVAELVDQASACVGEMQDCCDGIEQSIVPEEAGEGQESSKAAGHDAAHCKGCKDKAACKGAHCASCDQGGKASCKGMHCSSCKEADAHDPVHCSGCSTSKQKSGAVLNKTNKGKLRTASTLILSVLRSSKGLEDDRVEVVPSVSMRKLIDAVNEGSAIIKELKTKPSETKPAGSPETGSEKRADHAVTTNKTVADIASESVKRVVSRMKSA